MGCFLTYTLLCRCGWVFELDSLTFWLVLTKNSTSTCQKVGESFWQVNASLCGKYMVLKLAIRAAWRVVSKCANCALIYNVKWCHSSLTSPTTLLHPMFAKIQTTSLFLTFQLQRQTLFFNLSDRHTLWLLCCRMDFFEFFLASCANSLLARFLGLPALLVIIEELWNGCESMRYIIRIGTRVWGFF